MRLGIDAKWLHDGPPSGRTVVRAHVQGMLEAAGAELELHLFLDERARELPREFHDSRVHVHGVWARVNAVSNVVSVARRADALALDAVVYHNYVPLRARHARIAFVNDVSFRSHPEYFTPIERAYFAPMRWLVPSADRIATASEHERARLIRYGYGTAAQIDVVPHGVDPAYRPRSGSAAADCRAVLARFGLPGAFILYVGRLNVRKNVSTLLHALSQMAVRAPLVVAGAPDWKTSNLVGEAERLGLADRVRFIGAVSAAELEALYATATVFCFPSLDEGFGLPPLEAMASGCAVVSSNAASLPEVCGDAALLVDPVDAKGMAAALDRVLGDPVLRARLGDAGLAQARRFTLARSGATMLEVARGAIADRQRPA